MRACLTTSGFWEIILFSFRKISMSKSAKAKYCIGQLIQHKLFDYRGIILGVDLEFKSTDEWYEAVAKSRPPKNEPWYHVLVHQKGHQTYVAEQNLQPDPAIHN